MSKGKYLWGVVAAFAAFPVFADGIDGKWNATVDSPQGPVNLVFEFKAGPEAGKLEGAMSVDMLPAPAPLSEGKISGDEVTFKIALAFAEGMPPLVISYKGTLKGDELGLTSTMDMGQGPMEQALVAKRVKEQAPAAG